MKRIESFSRQSGLTIDEPFIEKSFFPIKHDKYITFNCFSTQFKKYLFLQDVIDLVKPYLDRDGIAIYQLGMPKDGALADCNVLIGSTTINQASYILESSLLHFGVDGSLNHIASALNKPVVSLYSGLPPAICSPHFSRKGSLVNLVGYEKGNLPTYNENENENTINKIKPEEVASNILDGLNIKHNLSSCKSIYMGKMYHIPLMECVPDFTPDPGFFPQSLINLRMDYNFDEHAILPFSSGRRLGIITDRPIEIRYLLAAQSSIDSITYKLSLDSTPTFVEDILKLGIKVNLVSHNEEEISDIRLNFFEWQVGLFKKASKKDIDISDEICDNTFFKTKKILMSKDGQFPSRAHWKKKENNNKIIDSPDFWEELDHYYIYNDAKKKENSSPV